MVIDRLGMEKDILYSINNSDIINAFATQNRRANFVWLHKIKLLTLLYVL